MLALSQTQGDAVMKGKRLLAFAAIVLAQAAYATETITYTYDARGRVIRVVRSGPVNNGTTTTYDHDNADNRRRVVVTGAAR